MIDDGESLRNSRLHGAVNTLPLIQNSAAPVGASQQMPTPTVADPAPRPPSFDTMDRVVRAMMAHATQGISPHALLAAWLDWSSHLARAPSTQLELWLQAAVFAARLMRLATKSGDRAELPFSPRNSDRRFADPAWTEYPYAFWQQAFLMRMATRQIRVMQPNNAARVRFATRQVLDVLNGALQRKFLPRQSVRQGAACRALARRPEAMFIRVETADQPRTNSITGHGRLPTKGASP